ncbi:hypothetical protein [Candidatus Poriferisodalis sp.]|uniref:hypothetical protein n=1 Tax=Candidatus Poriferisodalis sp. TaxID=3101277 RepID=UPI003B026032
MQATPRTHPPAALRLVDASQARGRLHRAGSSSAAAAGVLSDSNADPSGRFVLTARALAAASRDMGLHVPSFQSPPRSDQLDRSIQRSGNGESVVAVRVRGRPFAAVVADAIEGIVVCNRLDVSAAAAVRDELWREIEGSHDAAAAAAGRGGPCTTTSESGHCKPGTAQEPYSLDEAA